MVSLFDLTDEQVVEIYQRSVEEEVVYEFIEMVEQELSRRGLLTA
ncbi:sporulation histidine kinase inhibitor Sda [Rossellomorea vietnamensis]|uniref:Sporulation histidine kinase inhibitor Sda n=1 Tax=Rossellomorea vietnamensis TaxID=218284 RepID=A0A5D4MAR4_9BACI|nr:MULTISPECIES: sporulation histidine kinase inhibitor Sda [Bacillaceae]TYR98671.1 sporulation histidine kinase inhibitor Sda [Rossellomorea vietnamensis]